jgi:hypothetical protein
MRIETLASPAPVHECPPPRPGPVPPPAPVPPGPARDFHGLRFARTTGAWWRPGDQFQLRLDARLGSADGYGRWGDAVAAAAAASAGRSGAIAICDDRGRLYLYTVTAGCMFGQRPLHVGQRHESGYAFAGTDVRGIVDGDITVSRGDCLHPWVPAPTVGR